RIGHQFYSFSPCPFRRSNIASKVLRLPGKALAHGMPDKLVPKYRKCILFARMPCALDELNDTDALSVAKHTQCQSKSRRRFSLARPRIYDKQSLLDGLFRHLCVLYSLPALHFSFMAVSGFWVDLFHFTLIGRRAALGPPHPRSGMQCTGKLECELSISGFLH